MEDLASNEVKQNIITFLKETYRPGIDNLIKYMEDNGFFTAPCSSQYHLCKEGGLAEHSLYVCNIGLEELTNFMGTFDINSWILVSLLHDLGKIGQFGKANYVPNMIQDKKDKTQLIQSDKKPYTTNPDLLPIPHEIRSIQIITQFIKLTEEENFAILHHNGLYGDLKYQLNGKERPLQMLLHFADLWTSRVVEA